MWCAPRRVKSRSHCLPRPRRHTKPPCSTPWNGRCCHRAEPRKTRASAQSTQHVQAMTQPTFDPCLTSLGRPRRRSLRRPTRMVTDAIVSRCEPCHRRVSSPRTPAAAETTTRGVARPRRRSAQALLQSLADDSTAAVNPWLLTSPRTVSAAVPLQYMTAVTVRRRSPHLRDDRRCQHPPTTYERQRWLAGTQVAQGARASKPAPRGSVARLGRPTGRSARSHRSMA